MPNEEEEEEGSKEAEHPHSILAQMALPLIGSFNHPSERGDRGSVGDRFVRGWSEE